MSRAVTYARQQLGEFGEDLACRELEKRGHVILERRYRTKFGELDIVTRHGAFTVFVEVKAKHDCTYGDPYESVTPGKQHKVVMMATDYVSRHNLHDAPLRFDVVSIETGVEPPEIVVFEDAFRPGW